MTRSEGRWAHGIPVYAAIQLSARVWWDGKRRSCAIEEALDNGLPERFTAELRDQKRDALYQHIYEKYTNTTHNVYAAG